MQKVLLLCFLQHLVDFFTPFIQASTEIQDPEKNFHQMKGKTSMDTLIENALEKDVIGERSEILQLPETAKISFLSFIPTGGNKIDQVQKQGFGCLACR